MDGPNSGGFINRHVALRLLGLTTAAALLACGGGSPEVGTLRSTAGSDGQQRAAGPAEPVDVPAERRVALVVGNGSYPSDVDPLPNALRDAAGMATALRNLGFELQGRGALLDMSQRDLQDAVREFGRTLEAEADGRTVVALFYYAGHAIQRDGVNYLAPVDAHVRTDRDVQREMVSLDEVMRELEVTQGVRIVVLDACRNDPFAPRTGRGFRVAGGLAPQTAPSGTLVAYSTAPEQTAVDGVAEEVNSPYTGALITALQRDGLRIEDVFMEVREAVDRRTGGSQVPWEHSSLRRPFYFRPARTAALTLEERCQRGRDADACHVLGSRATAENRPADALSFYSIGCQADHAPSCLALTQARAAQGVAESQQVVQQRVERTCESGYAPGCTALGQRYARGDGVERDYSRAAALYERGCEGGDGHACRYLGFLYLNSQGVAGDDRRAMELMTRGCAWGVQDACGTTGYLYFNGIGVAQDYARGNAISERACDNGSMFACSNLGLGYHNGQGVPQDYARARQLYQQACDGDEMVGCSNLGRLYANGHGVTQDYARAHQLYQQACDGENMGGCANLGGLYYHGRGVTRDYARAHQLYQQACDASYMRGCERLGILYEDGNGVTQDYARAHQLYQQACDGDYVGGCVNLGVLYMNGRGVTRDSARAVQLYQRACDGDNMTGCMNLGVLYMNGRGVTRDSARANQLYQRACEGENWPACFNLAYQYYNGNGVRADRAHAYQLWIRACSGGHEESCGWLDRAGAAAYNRREHADALAYLTPACEGGQARSCAVLGLLYSNGFGVTQDFVRARQLYGRACQAGSMLGCQYQGWIYREGRGVPRDLARARQLYTQACEGDPVQCSGAAAMWFEGLGGARDIPRAVAWFQAECQRTNSVAACTQAAHRSGNWGGLRWHQSYTLRVTSAQGTRSGASSCTLTVAHNGSHCAVNARCGDDYVYPSNSQMTAELNSRGELVACRDTEDSSVNGGDPVFSFDVATGALQASDTNGRYGTYRVEARVQ